jgi:glycoside/pentoside/hexuronide:cation symporter, GPH family
MAWLYYTVITLGSAALWGIISGWLLYFYLPPGEQPLVPIAFYSLVILTSKLINIMLGLPVGYLSDHTHSRWGRRLPYIIGGALFLPIFFFLLWTPPSTTESFGNLFYLAIVLIAFSAAYEIHQIPYESLLPELAIRAGDRVSISTWKTVFLLIGNILAGFAGPLIAKLGYASSMGIFAAVAAPILILPGFLLRKRINHKSPPIQKIPFLESLKTTFGNRPFQTFTLSWGLMWTASTFILGTLPFIVTEVCRLDKADAVYFYLSGIVATLIAFPYVSKLSARYGMKAVYRGSLLAGAITLPCLLLIGDRIPMSLFSQGIFWIVLQSLGLAATQILPGAMAAEITDQDERLTGQRREGSFYSVWGLLNQVASGLAMGIIPLFLLLGRSRLDPNGPLGVRMLGLAGGILLLISFFVFGQYNLEKQGGAHA